MANNISAAAAHSKSGLMCKIFFFPSIKYERKVFQFKIKCIAVTRINNTAKNICADSQPSFVTHKNIQPIFSAVLQLGAKYNATPEINTIMKQILMKIDVYFFIIV